MMTFMTGPASLAAAKPVKSAPGDYDAVRRTIEFITETWRDQPSLDAIAAHVGMEPTRLQKLFRRWCGLSPKGFVQAITLDAARDLLRDSASVLDATYEVGLSGPGRLHDLFVTHEAMSPGEYAGRGAGVEIAWGFQPSPFGEALVMATPRGLAGIAFADGEADRERVLADMTSRWPKADFREDKEATASYASRIFDTENWRPDDPLRIVFIGTDFETRVWETLLRIPFGRATTYSDIAERIGRPTAARAVGTAVGRNPMSFVVPCHRVLGKSGSLCGYHWGLTRKRAILGWEAGLTSAAA
jgi:AraC family transcriptional regulator, regulatory protein of adaptative response / methylated-DNA-[protein]-cysteine methyltransferase